MLLLTLALPTWSTSKYVCSAVVNSKGLSPVLSTRKSVRSCSPCSVTVCTYATHQGCIRHQTRPSADMSNRSTHSMLGIAEREMFNFEMLCASYYESCSCTSISRQGQAMAGSWASTMQQSGCSPKAHHSSCRLKLETPSSCTRGGWHDPANKVLQHVGASPSVARCARTNWLCSCSDG